MYKIIAKIIQQLLNNFRGRSLH